MPEWIFGYLQVVKRSNIALGIDPQVVGFFFRVLQIFMSSFFWGFFTIRIVLKHYVFIFVFGSKKISYFSKILTKLQHKPHN